MMGRPHWWREHPSALVAFTRLVAARHPSFVNARQSSDEVTPLRRLAYNGYVAVPATNAPNEAAAGLLRLLLGDECLDVHGSRMLGQCQQFETARWR